MSLVLQPSVHFVCIAQDMPPAENAHLTTRLGGSFGKQAFKAYRWGLTNSRRTWAAAGQPVQTAKWKGKLWQKQSCWKEKPKRPLYKEGLFVCLLPVPSEYYLLYGKRERKEMEIKWDVTRGGNKPLAHHGTRLWLSVHFSLETQLHLVTPNMVLPFCSIAAPGLVQRNWGPSAHTTKHRGDFLTVLCWWGLWTRSSLPEDWLLHKARLWKTMAYRLFPWHTAGDRNKHNSCLQHVFFFLHSYPKATLLKHYLLWQGSLSGSHSVHLIEICLFKSVDGHRNKSVPDAHLVQLNKAWNKGLN